MGAKAKVSSRTTLKLGSVAAPVGLIKTTEDKAKGVRWERRVSGPAEEVAPRRAAEPVLDPLAGAPVILDAEPEAAPAVQVVTRGVTREDGTFVDLTDHIDRIEQETRLDAMDVTAFVRASRIPRERIIGSYWLAPEAPGGARVVRLLWEAMKAEGRCGVARWTKTSRQALGVLVPHASGAVLVLELAFVSAAREPDERALVPRDAAISEEELTAARRLVKALADAPVVLAEQEDDLLVKASALREAALEGDLEALADAPLTAAPSDDLADALRAAAGSA